MEITPKNNAIPIDVYVNSLKDKKISRTAGENTAAQRLNTDTVDISDTAKRVREARAQLDKIPEVDDAKVAELKARIESGDYDIDSEKIADKLLRESLLNDI